MSYNIIYSPGPTVCIAPISRYDVITMTRVYPTDLNVNYKHRQNETDDKRTL